MVYHSINAAEKQGGKESHELQEWGGEGCSFLGFFWFCLFIWLCRVLVTARGLLSCGTRTSSCGMHVGSSSLTRDGTPGPPALGVWSPSHCATREVPVCSFKQHSLGRS